MNFQLSKEDYIFFSYYKKPFTESIVSAFKQLLNTKHLYQSVEIPFKESDELFPRLIFEIRRQYYISNPSIEKSKFNQIYDLSTKVSWVIQNPYEKISKQVLNDMTPNAEFSILPPTIRSYCRVCKNNEPYNFVKGYEMIDEFKEPDKRIQVFALTYECQGCKEIPETFLISREKNKLTLSGRSPIEQVKVPKYLPKEQAKYVSDAIVAYNSGQTLAGLFQLRVFIEQYVRSKSSDQETKNIEGLFTEYASTLPIEFKGKFPSLQSVYDSLSQDIHLANPNIESYEKAIKDIERHFDAKRLFEINN